MGDPKDTDGVFRAPPEQIHAQLPPVSLGLRQAILWLAGWEELIDFPFRHGLILLCASRRREGGVEPWIDSVPALVGPKAPGLGGGLDVSPAQTP